MCVAFQVFRQNLFQMKYTNTNPDSVKIESQSIMYTFCGVYFVSFCTYERVVYSLCKPITPNWSVNSLCVLTGAVHTKTQTMHRHHFVTGKDRKPLSTRGCVFSVTYITRYWRPLEITPQTAFIFVLPLTRRMYSAQEFLLMPHTCDRFLCRKSAR